MKHNSQTNAVKEEVLLNVVTTQSDVCNEAGSHFYDDDDDGESVLRSQG